MNNVRKNDEAVSPVIAIILMVAITVVLAGVLYMWVQSMTDQQSSGPEILPLNVVDGSDSAVGGFIPQYRNFTALKHTGGDPLNLADYTVSAINTAGTRYTLVYSDNNTVTF